MEKDIALSILYKSMPEKKKNLILLPEKQTIKQTKSIYLLTLLFAGATLMTTMTVLFWYHSWLSNVHPQICFSGLPT